MLKDMKVTATIAVRDLDKARYFYEGKLGLKEMESEDGTYIEYDSGGGPLIVYQSKFAGGYKATVATWTVGGDVEKIVSELKSKGVPFEDYGDMDGATHKGDVYEADDMKMAWAKDPDGNILAFVSAA